MTRRLPDWNDLRDILMIAAAGSLSSAAKRAGVSQSTMSRRLAAIEAGGETVFLRDATGRLLPNARGQVFLQAARDMAAIYDRMRLAADDAPAALRIVACPLAARLFLADALPDWTARADVATEFDVTDDGLAAAPQGPEVRVTVMASVPEESAGCRIGQVAWGIYASPAYLREADWTGTALGHRVLHGAGALAAVEAQRWFARQGGTVALLAAHPDSLAQMVAKGVGVALLPRAIGDGHGGLVCLQADPCAPSEVWMIADATEALTPAVAGLLKWARGRFRPPAIRKSA
ncbi:MAG: hypothetical protein RIR62_998 [Pseudomonadota bacterium]|jgi:DNA-binding transcriptional LysR family regulator